MNSSMLTVSGQERVPRSFESFLARRLSQVDSSASVSTKGLPETSGLSGDDRDATARPLEKSVTVGDADLATGVGDETGVLELAHGQRERGSLDTDHLGQEILGDAEGRLLDSFIDLEKPTSGALVEPVAAVAQDQLSHRDHDDLGVPLQKADQPATTLELVTEDPRRHSHPRHRHLHDRPHR